MGCVEAAVRPSGDAPEDPEAVIGLTVSKLFFAPGSKRGEKKRKQQRFSGVVTEHNVLDGVDWWVTKACSFMVLGKRLIANLC